MPFPCEKYRAHASRRLWAQGKEGADSRTIQERSGRQGRFTKIYTEEERVHAGVHSLISTSSTSAVQYKFLRSRQDVEGGPWNYSPAEKQERKV
jgi:hypothetical protein